MKKAILLTALAVGLSAGAFAQGTIKFANTTASSAKTNDLQGHTGVAAGSYVHVALYWGVLGSTEAQLVQIGPDQGSGNGGVGSTAFINVAGNGIFTSGSGIWVTGSATPGSGTGTFQVRGWSGNFTSYAAAYAAAQTDGSVFVGVSSLFDSHVGGGGTPAEPNPSNLGSNFTGLTIAPVPEPSTIALGGLGAAALLLFRRRK